jgi:hypothetical protein
MMEGARLRPRQRRYSANPFEEERGASLNFLVHCVAHGINELVSIREGSRDNPPKRLRGIHSGETATMDKARGWSGLLAVARGFPQLGRQNVRSRTPSRFARLPEADEPRFRGNNLLGFC